MSLQFFGGRDDLCVVPLLFVRAKTGQLVLVPNRAGASEVFLDRLRVAGIRNFGRAGNGDFQCFGNRDFRVACACRGDFGGPGLKPVCLQFASPSHVGKEFIDVSVEQNM